MFIKEVIPALILKSGSYLAGLTQNVLAARSSPISLVLIYLTAKASAYLNRERR